MRFIPHPRKARSLVDVAIGLVLVVVGQAEAWVPFKTSIGHGSTLLAALVGAAMTLPLALRNRAPLAVALVVIAPAPLIGVFAPVRLLFFGGFLPLVIVSYTLAVRSRGPQAFAPIALPFVALVAIELEVPAFRRPGEVVFDWLWFGVAVGVGLVVRSRSSRAERSETQVASLQIERESVLREERARIARELHDVIAHSVSVIVVQAGAAEPLIEESPEQAREALGVIRAAGSDALSEMRRLLGILRTGTDELALDPQPGVSKLNALLASARAAGLAVELRIEGSPRPLAPGLDLAAYRIVQEALTNTRKHGRASHAEVALRYLPTTLEVEVVDNGSTTPSVFGHGHGLVGMRERAALYDGTLDLGARTGGGFFVRAAFRT